jgi:hypothetical protein
MKTTVVSRKSSKGQLIEINVHDCGMVTGHLDGQTCGVGIQTISPVVVNGVKYSRTVGKVLLITADEEKQINQAIDETKTPAYRAKVREEGDKAIAEYRRNMTLDQQREELVGIANDEWRKAQRMMDHAMDEDTGAEMSKAVAQEKAAQAASQAVRDFDAAHPEILAAIKAKNAEDVARFLRYD